MIKRALISVFNKNKKYATLYRQRKRDISAGTKLLK